VPYSDPILQRVSRALGRESAPTAVPAPPAVDEAVARLVPADADLAREFARVASEVAKMTVRQVSAEAVVEEIAGLLREREASRVVLTRSGLLEKLDAAAALAAEGFEAAWWSETTLDAAYEADAGITDVWFAVAETGSLVIRASAEHGRAVSLVPPVHIAIVEREQMVPDLVDAMQRIAAEGAGTGTVFITGPSKTSDIEMTLVTGVHGPMEVVVLLVASSE
jgi:L-lactate utilization protein LutC